MPRVERESASAIRDLVDHTMKHLRVLEAMNLPTDNWDDLIIHMIEVKLDSITRREWEREIEYDESPIVEQLIEFLQKRCQTLERHQAGTKPKENTSKSGSSKSEKESQSETTSHKFFKQSKPTISSVTSCATEQAEKQSGLSIDERIEEVRRLRLCHNCLRNDHFAKTCKSGSCRECSGRHNTLCHKPRKDEQPDSRAQGSNETESSSNNVTTMHQSMNSRKCVLMSTAVVNANHANGTSIPIRVLLDSASEANFITVAACNKLGLRTGKINEPVTGLNEMRSQVKQDCHVAITSRYSDLQLDVHCLVIPKITNELPSFKLESSQLQIPTTVKLADPYYYAPSKVEMLIGAEYFHSLLDTGKMQLGVGLPTLQNTSLGWLVAGPVTTQSQSNLNREAEVSELSVLVCSRTNCSSLNESITKFWEIEECKSVESTQVLSSEEQECEKLFESTIRDSSGRFIVRLPFRHSANELGESRYIAEKRLLLLERRFKGNNVLRQRYSEFMQDYIDLGHMSLVSQNTQPSSTPIVYLPHHGVIRENSATTKMRVVFNASAKTSSGKSLNDTLMVGPTLQDNLLDILLRFRLHKVAITADVQKMYRQVVVDTRDRGFQRILWRFSIEEPIQEYRLNTVTYGLGCAPYLAIRSIRQLASDEEAEFPEAARVTLQDFYVDDVLTGTESIEEAKELYESLKQLLHRGGFELHKWCSNHPEIFATQDETDGETVNFSSEEVVKTLGLEWQPSTDEFQFTIESTATAKTKREILSAISKLFDPLGLIGPIMIKAKLIMQATWCYNVEWDSTLPTELLEEWDAYVRDVQNVGKIQVPRRIIQCDKPTRLYLQGFCDASERAYGACVYVQSEDQDGNKTATLLCSKS